MPKKLIVVQTATMQCSGSSAPTQMPLMVTQQNFVKIEGKTIATEADKIPLVSIPSFGSCPKLNNGPCTPQLDPSGWQQTSLETIGNDRELTIQSYCMCTLGGKISFVTAGQNHVVDAEETATQYKLEHGPYASDEDRKDDDEEADEIEARFYFSAGAGHDEEQTGYIQEMLQAFETAGIHNTKDIAAHDNQLFDDVLFTLGEYSLIAYTKMTTPVTAATATDPETGIQITIDWKRIPLPKELVNWRILSTVKQIREDMNKHPSSQRAQLNLAGYSTGSVIMAQSGLMLAIEGKIIDNLILIGTPILNSSGIYKELIGNKNIKNIIRIDIPGDDVTNANNNVLKTMYNLKIKQNDHPHFKYAFNKDADKNRKELAEYLKNKGIK